MTGCAVRADMTVPMGLGRTGSCRVTVDKDRPGRAPFVNDKWGRDVGLFVLTSMTMPASVACSLKAPLNPKDDMSKPRPEQIMAAVADFLNRIGPSSGRQVRENLHGSGSTQDILDALGALVEEGYVNQSRGSGTAIVHTLVRPYVTDPITESET